MAQPEPRAPRCLLSLPPPCRRRSGHGQGLAAALDEHECHVDAERFDLFGRAAAFGQLDGDGLDAAGVAPSDRRQYP